MFGFPFTLLSLQFALQKLLVIGFPVCFLPPVLAGTGGVRTVAQADNKMQSDSSKYRIASFMKKWLGSASVVRRKALKARNASLR